jgi:uncharacterized membrane protein
MKMSLWWLAFVVGAILCWGVYVPVLHEGQRAMGGGNPQVGAYRAFLCVGIAYFITAVIIPAFLIQADYASGETFSFTFRGVLFSVLGGVAGAAGALCIIFSIKNLGNPLYIAPLVFAGAPIVNALFSLWWHPPRYAPGTLFYTGIGLAAVGAFLVLYSKSDLDRREREAQKQAAVAASNATAQAAAAAHE